MRIAGLLVTTVLYLHAGAHAQSPAPASGQQKETPPPSDVELERLYTRVRFENDGSLRREDTYWIKVLDEQGVRQLGEFPLPYQSETEDLAIKDVSVQKPDGTVTPTPASSVQDLSAMPGQLPIYVDIRQKIISVAALRPGDVLRVEAVWTVKKPIAPGHFWFEHSFNARNVVRDEQLEIDVPADRAIALKLAPGAPAEAHGGQGTTSGGRRVYTWKTSHEESAKSPVHQPGDDLPPADVRLSTFRDWNEFALWFTPLAILKPDAAVKAKADALTAGLSTDAEKIAAVYRFVSTQVRYVSLSFGLGRFAAHSPSDVLKNQFGDCKDKAVLIDALLAAAGVKALPVLLNTARSIGDDFASPLEFDHEITVAPTSARPFGGTWMDATIEVAPIGMLVDATRDKRVLLLDGTGRASVIRTPSDPPFASTNELTLDGSINAIGVMTATGTLTLRGDIELITRAAVRQLPRSALKDFVTGMVDALGVDGDVSDAGSSDPADTTNPFRLTFAVRKKGVLSWAEAQSRLTAPTKAKLEWTSEDDRKDLEKLLLGSPVTTRMRVSIELPAGYDATAPAPVDMTRAGISFKSTYAVDGRRLTAVREISRTSKEVPRSAFGEYAALGAAIDADAKQSFRIAGHADATPPIPADATAAELYNAAHSAWNAKRYEPAAVFYKRATELDPKMGDAWIGLGLAYERLEKYDDAAAAIRKQIELDPYNKRAFGDLGFVLKSAGKTSEAIVAYTKHVELNPLDGDAFKELGALDEKLDHYGDEAVALEKAASLLKPDAWVFADLGTAYMETKSPEKARRNFDRALELESTPAMWTKVAWNLAEGGVDLDRAEELARKSEKQLVADSATLDVKSATAAQLERTDTLAWTWDTIGWIRFQRRDLAAAEEYTHAAWLLGGHTRTASHMGQVYQKRDKLADALSFYLTAQSMAEHPTPEMIQRVKGLSGGGDLTLMIDTARRMLPSYRYVPLSTGRPSGPPNTADFLVLLTNNHKALDVRFESGSESVRAQEAALRSARYPVEVPGAATTRVLVIVKVACDAKQVCAGLVEYPGRATLKRQAN